MGEFLSDEVIRHNLEEKLRLLPAKPGVYLMKNDAGEIIYVGKAVSLRNRVRSYFQAGRHSSPKVAALVGHIVDFEYIVTDSEVEALILECNLIKQHSPWYNIRLKDDKSYPYVKVTLHEPFPRVAIVRRMQKDGSRYFGPYTNVQAVRQTVDFLRRVFPLRTCKQEIGLEGTGKRPCLNYHIRRCHAPCAQLVSQEDYRKMIDEVVLILEGRHSRLLDGLEKRMQAAAQELRFEEAARLRDQIQSLAAVVEKQKMVSFDNVDQDILGYAQVKDLACVQVFFVRSGKIIGNEHFFLETPTEDSGAEIMSAFVEQYYATATFIPKELLLPVELLEPDTISRWLTDLRGSRVYLRVPQRGEKKRLVEMVEKNAELVLNERINRQARERARRQKGLEELQAYLGLDGPPQRIEAFDISNIQGSEAVGSMVVFREGEPVPGEYRRFRIRGKDTPDDYAMMQEVISRRFARGFEAQGEAIEGGFRERPQLVLIDGGKGQLGAVREVMKGLGVGDIVTLGLAERLEEVYIEGQTNPVALPKDSEALYMLQRLRDEAHRFALTYHRQLRAKRTTRSVLDEIPGIGPKRKKQLIQHFGSVQAVRAASLEELLQVPNLPEVVAQRVYQELRTE
ncbi:MAG: excinuclease ABC subunit UvrC [Firmicutes bacterium]|nr:excinuclease ABC subunit UvrC [Bacillota bacterium]